MNVTRKNFIRYAIPAVAGAALLGCATTTTTNTGNGTVTTTTTGIPTIQQIQTWGNILVPELPTIVTDLEMANTLVTAASISNANQAVAAATQMMNTIDLLAATAPTTPTTISQVNQLMTEATVVLSLIPATAPYAPLVTVFQTLVNAYVAQASVTVPTTPDTVAFQQGLSQSLAMHSRARLSR